MKISHNEFKVSIVILTKNSCDKIEKVLDKIQNQIFGGEVEIIVIDSGSTDETLKILKRYGVELFEIPPKEFHHSRTRNFGASKSKGDYLVFLTSDAIPVNNGWLNSLLKPFVNKDIGATYGRQIAYPGTRKTEMFFYQYFYPVENKILEKKDIKDIKRFYLDNVFISNVCAAIKRDLWDEIKFDEDIINHEDKDFTFKLLNAGYKVFYEPKASVYHSHNYSLLSVFKRRFNDGAAFSAITIHGKSNFLSKGIKYFSEEMRFYIVNRYILWIPYAFLYDILYFLGFLLGSKEQYCPGFIKNKLIYQYG